MVSSLLERDLHPDNDNTKLSQLSAVIHAKTAGNPFFVVRFLQMLRHESFLRYRSWAHDKLQRVAYSMIPARYRNRVHKNLGEILQELFRSSPDRCWILYLAADQMNRLTDVVGEDNDNGDDLNADIARLCLRASKISVSKSAFFPALDMLRSAAKRLGDMKDPWKADSTYYPLSLEVYSFLAELAMRFGSREEALDAAQKVLKHANAKKPEERSRAQLVFVLHEAEGGSGNGSGNRDYLGAVESIRTILLEYGVRLPSKIIPGKLFNVEARKLKARLLLGNNNDDDDDDGRAEAFLALRRLDETNGDDRRTMIVIKMLSKIVEFLSHGNGDHNKRKDQHLRSYAIARILNLSIREGTCAETALAIAGFAADLKREGRARCDDAREYAELAVRLVDTFPFRIDSCHALVHTWATLGVLSHALPFHSIMDPLLDLHRTNLRAGGIAQGFVAWITYAYAYVCVGLPLGPLDADLRSIGREAGQFGATVPAAIRVLISVLRQTIHNLQEPQQSTNANANGNTNPTVLKGDVFDQEDELGSFEGPGLETTLRDVNSLRLMLACIYREWETAETLVVALEPHLLRTDDELLVRRHVYLVYMGYASIVLAGSARTHRKRLRFRRLAKKITGIFRDRVRDGCPNALPVVETLDAIASPSKERFRAAFRSTARIGLIQHAAIVCETAALFFGRKGGDHHGQYDEGSRDYYLSEACRLYAEWGAIGKSQQLIDNAHQTRSEDSDIDYDSPQQQVALLGLQLERHHRVSMSRRGSNIKGRTRFSPELSSRMKEITPDSRSSELLSSSGSGFGTRTRTRTSRIVHSVLVRR
eukprot:jgi/Psemu1/293565/fgenesh1_pg.2728_\